MTMEVLSDNIVSIELPAEPRAEQELANIAEECSKKFSYDIILDFTYPEVLTSSSISNLTSLRSWVEKAGRKLVLYNVRVITRCIFDVAGITSLFEFAKDKDDALRIIRDARKSPQ
jgi:anti-anti-sigma regulatory factor